MAFRPTEIGILIMVNRKLAYEKLLDVMRAADGSTVEAAEKLGIGKSTLKRWVTRLDAHGFPIRADIEKLRAG